MFRLKLFGSASIDGPDGPLTGRPVQRRRLALLALLASARDRGLTRDKLVGYLWPDSDAERGRHLLSDSIYRINQAVGAEALVAVGDEVRLDPARLPSDAWEFGEAVERGEWRRAVELHAAPFLDGFFLTGADELERWVDARREALARERARALERLAEAAERDGAEGDAVACWRRLAAQDPYSSRIALRLMRALDRAGDPAAALRHARVHSVLLEEELRLEPDAQLLAFVEELRARPRASTPPAPPAPKAGGAAAPADTTEAAPPEAPADAPSPPAPNARSVAVLPFVNLSADPDNAYFAEGVTDDVIAQLSKIGALSVISRGSIARLTDRERSPRELGAALGATNVLAGSVRRAGDRVRIVAQLVDADTGQCLWAETYDRRLSDVFAIQSDVALQIAAALQARLSPDESRRIRREPTRDVQAYQLYLRGRSCFVRFSNQGMRQAVVYFERAIERDPGYALAWAGIGKAYAELAETGMMEPNEAYARAREAVARALALDEALADAHCVLAQLRASWEFEWAGAEREFRRALELSPSAADAYDLFGRMCAGLGRFEEAVALHERAQELDPLAHRADLATAFIRAGRYDEALAEAEKAVEFDSRYARARATLGWACIRSGLAERGIAELERAVALAPDQTAWLAQLGQAYALAGRPDDARDVLRRLEDRSREHYVSPYHLAYVHTGLADHDRAVDLLEQAFRERAGSVYAVKGSFLFTPLHAHPRFRALLRRMNLE